MSELNPYIELDFVDDLSGELESREVKGAVSIEFRDSGVLNLAVSERFKRLRVYPAESVAACGAELRVILSG